MPRAKVLVVDDSRTLRLKLQRALAQSDYEVVLASSGEEALGLVAREKPQLIVLDIQMPDLDGYGVCERLQQMGEPWDRIPIVFLTIVESHALRLLGTKMGAYLRKPVAPAALLHTVAECLQSPDAPPRTAAEIAI